MRNSKGQFVSSKISVKCRVCHGVFMVINRRAKKAKYCSHKCQGIAFRKRVGHVCTECGEKYYRRPCDNKRNGYSNKFCSHNCYKHYQKRVATYSRGLLADLYAWKKWAEAIYIKDNFTCQKCGKRGGRLHAHHLYMVSEYPEMAFDCDNGRTVCVPCHKAIHRYFRTAGRKQGEFRERWLEQWLPNPEPSRVESRKVQRLLEGGTPSLMTSKSAL